MLGKQIETDELTLQTLLDLDAAGHIDQIQEVGHCWFTTTLRTTLRTTIVINTPYQHTVS